MKEKIKLRSESAGIQITSEDTKMLAMYKRVTQIDDTAIQDQAKATTIFGRLYKTCNTDTALINSAKYIAEDVKDDALVSLSHERRIYVTIGGVLGITEEEMLKVKVEAGADRSESAMPSEAYVGSVKAVLEKVYPEPRNCGIDLDGWQTFRERGAVRGLKEIANAFSIQVVGLNATLKSEGKGLRRSEPSF
jgi:hypothetical protein